MPRLPFVRGDPPAIVRPRLLIIRQARQLYRHPRGDRSVTVPSTVIVPLIACCAVTSLESVVLQLQDSCREARKEAGELRQDNARVRQELRDREKFWRALYQARKAGQASDAGDMPPLPSTFSAAHSQSNVMGNRLHASQTGHYNDDSIGYQGGDESTTMCNGNYTSAPSHAYPGHSPSLSYTGVDNEHLSSSGAPHQMGANRPSKFGQYPYPVQTMNRDNTSWNHNISSSSSGNSDPTTNLITPDHNSVGSPTLTSPELYVNRPQFVDEQKVSLGPLETTPYIFPGSRSISPSTSTPPSSSSTSLTSPFQFAFPPEGTQDRPEFEYRRHSTAHNAEVTLHGGTADISLASEGVRYRIGPRRANSGPERPLLPSLPNFSGSEHERGSSEGEASATHSHHPKSRSRRGMERFSRSPSPTTPPISGTLSVIKAQAFGALRRTRTRTKKSSTGAAKVAMEVLEARGIGMGVMPGSKRPRLQNEHADLS